MVDISKTDKNFKIETKIKKEDIVFYNSLDKPFEINGVFYEDGRFRRIPESVAKTVNEGVHNLHANTAGGRIRFKTNSSYVAINVKLDKIWQRSFFAGTGITGFDLYVREDNKERYFRTFIPPIDMTDGYESVLDFGTEEYREITINFPLYCDVCSLHIGVSSKSQVLAPREYSNKKKIVYYGSSITQGGCASRPGTSYESIISRALDCDYINLGFAGNAKAEKEIAEYIAKLPMDVFVYDYDHNAPNVEFLKETHRPMFDIIREKNPDLPIVLVTRPNMAPNREQAYQREQVILNTYNYAIEKGDKNVYFVSGKDMFNKFDGESMLVDGVHPNDLGFYSMAEVFIPVLAKLI